MQGSRPGNLSPGELLDRLAAAGVTVRRAGDTLHLRPANRVPQEMIPELRRWKPSLLSLIPEDARAEQRTQPEPWRLRVVKHELVPGPVTLNDSTCIIDTDQCAEVTLADLALAVAHKNAGRETAFTRLIDEYTAVLGACGITAVVEAVS